MKNLMLFSVLFLGLAGCAMKTKVMDLTAVSMTHPSLNPGETLKETGPVTGQYCTDSYNDKGSIGLIDESVKDAQKQSGVDFILNASIWREGKCVSVEGTGAKIASNGSVDAAPTATKAKKKHH